MTDESNAPIPKWIETKLFEQVLQKNIKGYKRIKEFNIKPGMGAGENYATVMLRVNITVELEDASSQSLSFMLKTKHDNEMVCDMMEAFDMFDVEKGMYDDIVPEFENLYANAGVELKFGAKSYELPTNEQYILLEDLGMHGFKNANRVEGLNMEHSKCVLRKIAQWHAASAVLFATKGPYHKKYLDGLLKDEGKEFMTNVCEGMEDIFRKCVKNYSNYSEYADDIVCASENMMSELYKAKHADPNEFNVLNHGDFWCNNIMFQYDDLGKIKETYFVDYQLPLYGTPAQDLYFFILSSTKLELKLKQFDYFIKFYHDNLVENLKLLKYSKKIPTLRDIHIMLHKYSVWGYSTTTGVMGTVLLDPTHDANMENFVGESDAGTAVKTLMYSNDRCRKHMEAILPWLKNRGALSYS